MKKRGREDGGEGAGSCQFRKIMLFRDTRIAQSGFGLNPMHAQFHRPQWYKTTKPHLQKCVKNSVPISPNYLLPFRSNLNNDQASKFLPLIKQKRDKNSSNVEILEQPLDLSQLSNNYISFADQFINKHSNDPFFIYMAFTHVHTTDPSQHNQQYAGCKFKGTSSRGIFGDAVQEVDYMVGEIFASLTRNNLHKKTLILFTSDNGPAMAKRFSGGSPGIMNGQYSGYFNVGKGSTWEGGIRMPAFAYWPEKIKPNTKSSEIISSMDIFPTLSKILNIQLPKGVIYDGKDMSDILFKENGKTKHHILFFYGGAHHWLKNYPSAARMGAYKAHFDTGPGLHGCKDICPNIGNCVYCKRINYCKNIKDCKPLIFNVEKDPSETYPIFNTNISKLFVEALRIELKTHIHRNPIEIQDQPGEKINEYGICCNRHELGTCNC